MQHLLCDDLWARLRQLSKKSRRASAAVAFFSDAGLLEFRRGDLLIVDASDGRIQCGDTSARALASVLKRKTAPFSLPNLHAKVFVFGKTAVIGSANVSRSSSSTLIEAALVTDDGTTVSQTKALIESLRQKATKIDPAFIARILRLEVQKRRAGGLGKKAKPKVGKLGRRTWILGVRELAADAFPMETELADGGRKLAARELSKRHCEVTWIRCTDRKSKLIKTGAKGDSAIQVWTPLTGNPVKVLAAASILRKQVEPTCTRFYVEESAQLRRTSLPLTAFRKLARRAGLPGKLGKTSERCLTEDKARLVSLLWNEFRRKSH
jgi:hypothetical protein